MSTYSDKRLRNAMRSFQSKAFEGGTSYIGSKLPFDEQVNSALLGVVDVFFPEDLQIRFYHRDTLVDDGRPSKTGYAYLVVDTPLKTEEVQNWMSNIPGTSTTDKKTGKPCIVPSNDYICTVEAIKGDPDIDDVSFVCLGFLLMRGEEFEGRLVEPYVTGSDVDEKITDADIPGMIESAIKNMVYPVGSIIHSSDIDDARISIPDTVWERIQARFLLGADDNTYIGGATGGNASTTLTIGNIPSHKHDVAITSSGAHTSGTPSTNSTDSSGGSTTGSGGSGSTGSGGVHDHELLVSTVVTYTAGSQTRLGGTGASPDNGGHIENSTSHTHSIPSHTHTTPNHSHSLNNHTHPVQNHTHTVSESDKGGGQSFSNMPPYRVVYIWERTA